MRPFILIFVFAVMLGGAVAQAQEEASVLEVLEQSVRKKPEKLIEKTPLPAQKMKTADRKTTATKIPRASQASPVRSNMMVMENVQYDTLKGQVMDVYAPYGSGNAAVILYATGETGMPGHLKRKMEYWTHKGIIFVVARYREDVNVRLQAEDIARALYYVQTQSRTWGADGNRLAVMGHGFAGHLVMLMASDPTINKGLSWRGNIALASSAYDLPAVMRRPHAEMLDKLYGKEPEGWSAASPYALVKGRIAPSLFVCTSLERWACDDPEKFQSKARRMGNAITVLAMDKDNTAIGTDLGMSSPYSDTVDAFLKEIGILP